MKALVKFTAAAALLSAMPLPLFAQDAAKEDVTVVAPYVVKQSTTGLTRNRVTTVSVSRTVRITDLDLASTDGQAALESRVRQVAGDVCRELDRRFPSNAYPPVESRDCVKDAVAMAMIQVHDAEKAARPG